MGSKLRDAQLSNTKALPNGAASVYCDGFDLGRRQTADAHLANCELEIAAPALATADLGDAATMKYTIQQDSDSAFGTVASLYENVLTQTGAGGAGAAAATVRVRLSKDVLRYVRVKATNSAAGDASDKSMTTRLIF